MPFGLMNAPAIFQRFINEVLSEALDRYAYVYLDDILIFSHTREEHTGHVQHVLKLLLESPLYVKLEKSKFQVPAVSFLESMQSVIGHAKGGPSIPGVCHLLPEIRLEQQSGGGPLYCADFRWTAKAQQAFEELTWHLQTCAFYLAENLITKSSTKLRV
ncbi:hypothetical protein NFI96_000944 [Prochilodus magdalenae]|nr:hypothetical protein NFI96_000944 [Prochilodus magdalenae]